MGWKVLAAVFGASIAVSACSVPPPELYLLRAPDQVEPLAEAGRYELIGLEEFSLPSYGDDDKIVSVIEGGRIRRDDANRWAEQPGNALTRVVSRSLGRHLDANVVVEPFPRGFEPDLRVVVRFDQFLRGMEGRPELGGQFFLISGDGREVLHIEPFELSAETVDASPAGDSAASDGAGGAAAGAYSDFVRAVSASAAQLSQKIGEAALALPE